MERKWIFQANPQRYDIDAALRELSEIAWRAPQHVGEIQPGDVVAVWRSGSESGIVAVGRIVSTPAAAPASPAEDRFRVSPDEAGSEITRVTIRLRPCAFVPKDRVAAFASMRDHPIVTAPMGTVFPVSGEQWQELARELPEPPAGDEPGSPEPVPRPFAWKDRKKSAFPPPGGYGAYLESLERILRHVEAHRPERSDAIAWTQAEFDVSAWRSRMTLGFLQAVSLIREEAGRLELTQYGTRWLETGDASLLMGLLHSRVRFLGEMLEALREPRTAQDLLDIANDSYAAGWTTRAQIDRRRGWLESAGAIEADDEGRLRLTERGREILEKLDLTPPMVGAPRPDALAAQERTQPIEERGAEPADQPVRPARRPSSEEGEADQVARCVEAASREGLHNPPGVMVEGHRGVSS